METSRGLVPNTKLASLLGLAVGSLALPQDGTASVIYSGPMNVKVGFSAGFGTFFKTTLVPGGTAAIGLATSHFGHFKGVSFGSFGLLASVRAGYDSKVGRSFVKMTHAGKHFHSVGSFATSASFVGARQNQHVGPNSFSHKYASFVFVDAATGFQPWFGWAEMSLDNSNPSGPDVTFEGFAYDNTGAELKTGALSVPDAAPTAPLTAFAAALVLGADGVRRWRAQKKAVLAAA